MINDHSDKYAHEWEDTACRMIDDIQNPLVVSLQAALEAEIEDPHTLQCMIHSPNESNII